ARYKLDTVDGLEGYEVLEKIGKKRGFVVSGGEIDMERAANMVLDELRGAKIGHITLEIPRDIEAEN
ncbi:MAG: ribosome biogenesis GTPase YlqF, partial [Clostridia bacterium]|nr:ribosome biogenesis GTPase YlqF [Clostridia bacterium]